MGDVIMTRSHVPVLGVPVFILNKCVVLYKLVIPVAQILDNLKTLHSELELISKHHIK